MDNAGAMENAITLMDRGGCTFVEKVLCSASCGFIIIFCTTRHGLCLCEPLLADLSTGRLCLKQQRVNIIPEIDRIMLCVPRTEGGGSYQAPFWGRSLPSSHTDCHILSAAALSAIPTHSLPRNASHEFAILNRYVPPPPFQVMAAQRAGAVAVIVVNNVLSGNPDGGLVEMGGDGRLSQITIPAVLVSHSAGQSIRCGRGRGGQSTSTSAVRALLPLLEVVPSLNGPVL